jgi:hypothetical protein
MVMEEKINIAEILKDKPQGTKLYDLLYNIDVELDTISTTDTETVAWCTNETDNNTTCHRGYSEFGTVRGGLNGLQILLPSKEMRDWGKFAWKKGDVLVCTDGKAEVIFERFDDDNYTSFVGKHYLESYGKDGDLLDYEQEHLCDTANYTKESDETVQCYINTIEERLGGKLNRKTLEVEKAQPEFKDGDIAFADFGNTQAVFIVSGKTDLSEGYNSFIALDLRGLTLDMGCMSFFKKDLCKLRLATDEEKQQLFDALTEEGKAWDAEKKEVVGLKPKVELKPFDKVLVKDNPYGSWEPALFWKKVDAIDLHPYMVIGGKRYRFCEPYEGNEHFLND